MAAPLNVQLDELKNHPPRTEGQAICIVLAWRWCQAVSQTWVQKLKENAFHLIVYFWLFEYPK